MSDHLVRFAAPGDVTALAELSAQLGYPATESAIAERLGPIEEDPTHQVWVAVPASAPRDPCVGWIHAFVAHRIESDASVEIGGLTVAESARRQGVGRLLVAAVHMWAESLGIARVRVRCREERAAAHRFYESIGFGELKRQQVFELRR